MKQGASILATCLALVCALSAQGPPTVVSGRIARIQPRWEVNAYGDQVIVSRVTLPTATVDVVGGTLDGLTLQSSHTPVLRVGDAVTVYVDDRGRAKRVAVSEDGFSVGGYRWSASRIPVAYYVNPVNTDVTPLQALTAIRWAANVWGATGGAPVSYAYAGPTTGSSLVRNFKNEVFFRNVDRGGLIAETLSWYNASTMRLLEADIVFYDYTYRYYVGTSGCSAGLYLEDVATHEFGHGLGIGHSPYSAATMYYRYSRCSTAPRTLHWDDLAALQFLYGPR